MKVKHQPLIPDGLLMLEAEIGDELPNTIYMIHNDKKYSFVRQYGTGEKIE